MATIQRSAARNRARLQTEPYRSILVAIDFSPATDRIIERTLLLPLADGARLVLVHVVPRGLPEGMRQAAVQDATRELAALARNIEKKQR